MNYLVWLYEIDKRKVLDFFGENVMKIRSEILRKVVEQVYEVEGNGDERKVLQHLPLPITKIHESLILLQQSVGVLRIDPVTKKQKVNPLNSQCCYVLGKLNFDWPGENVVDPMDIAKSANALRGGGSLFKVKQPKTTGAKDLPIITLYQLFRWSFSVYIINQIVNNKKQFDTHSFLDIPLHLDDFILLRIHEAQSRAYASNLEHRIFQPRKEEQLNKLKCDLLLNGLTSIMQEQNKEQKEQNKEKQKRKPREKKIKEPKPKKKPKNDNPEDKRTRMKRFKPLDTRKPQKKKKQRTPDQIEQDRTIANQTLNVFLERQTNEENKANEQTRQGNVNQAIFEETNREKEIWTSHDIDELANDIENDILNCGYVQCPLSNNHAFHEESNYSMDGCFYFEKFPQLSKPTSFIISDLCPINCHPLHQKLLKHYFTMSQQKT